MAEYISNFIPGFEDTVSRHILRELGGTKIIAADSGFVHFSYAGKPEFVAGLPFINNSFFVIAKYRGESLSFDEMVKKAAKMTFRLVGGNIRASFRVRFSKENRFEKVPKSLLDTAERAVMKNTGMDVNRLSPEYEFWFIIRRGGSGYFGQLLNRRKDAANRTGDSVANSASDSATFQTGVSTAIRASAAAGSGGALNRGELRPELACLLCLDCDFSNSAAVCDPFAGYGSIPMHIQKNCAFKKLYVSDNDPILVGRLKKTVLGNDAKVAISCADAASLPHIENGSVDLIITDPPWGFVSLVDDITGFYRRVLAELKRILSPSGKIVILTGRPAEMSEAAAQARLAAASRTGILVNGKKAAVIIFTQTTFTGRRDGILENV